MPTTYNEYEKDQLVRVSAAYTTQAGSGQDPDNVFLDITDPDGVVTTYEYLVDAEIVRSSLGAFYADISVGTSGAWRYKWYSTGSGQASERHTFHVLL